MNHESAPLGSRLRSLARQAIRSMAIGDFENAENSVVEFDRNPLLSAAVGLSPIETFLLRLQEDAGVETSEEAIDHLASVDKQPIAALDCQLQLLLATCRVERDDAADFCDAFAEASTSASAWIIDHDPSTVSSDQASRFFEAALALDTSKHAEVWLPFRASVFFLNRKENELTKKWFGRIQRDRLGPLEMMLPTLCDEVRKAGISVNTATGMTEAPAHGATHNCLRGVIRKISRPLAIIGRWFEHQ